jgi:hypothetical protein
MQGHCWRGTGAGFFFLAKFRQNVKFKKKHNQNDFGEFQLPSVREKYSKNARLLLYIFQCVAINIEG